ncbi:GntR family transcriptional regulator [Nocardioides insulae]|uniref:GntR family transcriptional regulator n=1 Tax=Nocardioides insulae TaxID=394734 RepID=UPI00040C430C|nr:GntR family transcriptional regulator [Nocardioides insulae]
MDVSIDPEDGAPPYEQIRRQIEARITSGDLPVGERLPPVRRLADTLAVANGTVARAYRELEQAGLIETRGRAGTLVAGPLQRRAGQLLAEAAAYVERARLLGASDSEIVANVGTVLDAE